MHGTYEANLAMHDCDVMVCIGARFDDRVTGRLDGFSPRSREDPRRHRPVLDQQERRRRRGDRRRRREAAWRPWPRPGSVARTCPAATGSRPWWEQIQEWRKMDSYRFRQNGRAIKPQTAVRRLYEATKHLRHLRHDRCRPAPDVGRPALPVRAAAALDDLGRPRHHGLRLPGRDRRADRRIPTPRCCASPATPPG